MSIITLESVHHEVVKIAEQLGSLLEFLQMRTVHVEQRFQVVEKKLDTGLRELQAVKSELKDDVKGVNQQLLRHMQITDDHQHDMKRIVQNHEHPLQPGRKCGLLAVDFLYAKT